MLRQIIVKSIPDLDQHCCFKRSALSSIKVSFLLVFLQTLKAFPLSFTDTQQHFSDFSRHFTIPLICCSSHSAHCSLQFKPYPHRRSKLSLCCTSRLIQGCPVEISKPKILRRLGGDRREVMVILPALEVVFAHYWRTKASDPICVRIRRRGTQTLRLSSCASNDCT